MKKLIIAGLIAGSQTGLYAETTNETVEAERIVVTATRNASPVRSVAGNPTVITAEDIKQGHYTTVPEALQKEAGVFFRNYADNPSQAAVDMRGFGDNSHGRVLVLVDGRRLNEADMAGLNWSAVPVSTIERIEVLNGPAAALYGDNAIGGVINIITAKGSEETTVTLSATAGSYEALTQDSTLSGTTGGLGYTASASHQSGDGYRDRSRYDNTAISTGFHFSTNDLFSGNASFSVIDRQYQLPGSLSTAQAQDDRTQSDENSEVRDTQYNAQIDGEFTPDEYNTFALAIGYRHLDQIADMNREYGNWGTYYDATKDTWTVEPRYILTLPMGDAVNETTIGLDYRNETILIDRFSSESHSVRTADAKVEQETLDFYLNDRLFLLEDTLILNAGGRVGQSRLKIHDTDLTGGGVLFDEIQTRHENAFSFGLTALPTDYLKLYAKYDEFYRFPFTDEQALYYGSTWIDGYTDLKPESGQNIEIGGSFTPTRNTSVSLSIYRMEMENEICYNPFTYENENLPDTLHQGVELTARCDPSTRLGFGLVYNYSEAEFDAGANQGKRIPWVPKNHARATMDIRPTDRLTLTAGATYTGKMYAINDNGNNGSAQGGYTLVDLMLTYTTTCKGIEWDVFAGIDNLFEKEYDLWQVSNSTGTSFNHYPAPERTWKAGLSIKF